jgi:hypothetical protein
LWVRLRHALNKSGRVFDISASANIFGIIYGGAVGCREFLGHRFEIEKIDPGPFLGKFGGAEIRGVKAK